VRAFRLAVETPMRFVVLVAMVDPNYVVIPGVDKRYLPKK
jgi:hypothetical protein